MSRDLIHRLRHDAPTPTLMQEAADALEALERAQRRPDARGHLMLGPVGILATHPRALAGECTCFDGVCRHEVVNGRTVTGQRCKARMVANLTEDVAPGVTP